VLYLLHGAFGSPSDWEDLRARLPQDHDTEALDLWQEPAGLSLAGWGRRFAQRVKATGDTAPVLLGYSLGGRLALHALAAEPTLWAGAILVSTHPGLDTGRERAARLEHDRRWLDRLQSLPWETFLNEWNAQRVFAPRASPGKASNYRPEMSKAFREWSLGTMHKMSGSLAKNVRCLWVSGALDEKFTKLAAEAAAASPSHRHTVIAGAGHRVPWVRPEAFAAVVRSFLDAP